MKKVFLFVALFAWIGFSASAQVHKESKKEEQKEEQREAKMQMDHNMHHWVFKNGKVMEMKDGKSTEMTTETHVGDVWIRTNGEVVMKDNKVVHLKADQYVDEKGKIHTMMHKNKMEEKKMEPPKVTK
jgi:hypothetical protein